MRSKPISINVGSKRMALHNFLLEMPERPIPKEPTHYIVVDILNKDLSIKRVTIYFNPLDTWTNPDGNFGQNNPAAVGALIGDNLSFLGRDPNTTAYVFWILEIATNTVVSKGTIRDYCNWDA